jgi:hypothetical protein
MYDDWLANMAVTIATVAVVALVVLVQYEGLVALSRWLAHAAERPARRKVLYAIGAILVLHVIEIWLFGVVLWMLLQWPATGTLAGDHQLHLFDTVYLSAITFTTVGFGDLAPVGAIRFLAGTEALVGFVMLGWSVSFTYLEMERYWRVR